MVVLLNFNGNVIKIESNCEDDLIESIAENFRDLIGCGVTNVNVNFNVTN